MGSRSQLLSSSWQRVGALAAASLLMGAFLWGCSSKGVDEKVFDPKKVYGDAPNPTQL